MISDASVQFAPAAPSLLSAAYYEMVRLLTEYAWWRDGNVGRSDVDALTHATQAATRAERAGCADEFVVACLVHDAARPLHEIYHGEVVAEMMRDRLSDDLCNALRHHGVFQADVVHHTKTARCFSQASWYADAVRLAGYDAVSFDASYDTLPLDHFLPALRVVMA